ncbi:MAG: preprotein translocase subunit SecE [Acidobacteria bacterium]|nr:preprotein translocase subunit SecE [Acidobacteriota bacterium]
MATSSTREGSGATTESNEQQIGPRSPNWVTNIRQFWHEVKLEMKKVSWPVRNEVVNTTIIVVIAIFFFAFYLFLTDIFFSYLIVGIEWVAKWIFG